MRKVKLLSNFIVLCLFVQISLSAPMTEDDEYEDDVELYDRKAAMQKLQQELEEKQQASISTTTTTTTSTTRRPYRVPILKQRKKWVLAKDIRGYQVLSDGPHILTELIRTRPMLRIRIDMPDTARHVEKIYQKRYIELKIRNWNKVHKVHVKVPFGYNPEDLKIVELRDHIDIIAPVYSDIEEFDK